MNRAQKYFLVFVLALSTSAIACRLDLPQPKLVFTPDALPEAQAGVPYEVTISISENTSPAGGFHISRGSLPEGLVFEAPDGEQQARIYGTPKEVGVFKFEISVWCYGTNTSGQSGEKEYTIEVK